MIKFIISTPCIPGKDMNIADLRGRAIISERGCSAKLLIIPQVLMSVFLIWRKP